MNDFKDRVRSGQGGLPAIGCRLRRLQAGQTLLEILLAFSIAILVLSSIVVGVTTSLSNTQYTKNQNLANSYSQEGMAVVRQLRDSNWSDFTTKTGIYCLPQGSTTLAPYDAKNCFSSGISIGIFARSIEFAPGSVDCAAITPATTPTVTPGITSKSSKVTVKVAWSDNKCPIGTPLCHKVELITCFSNIDQKSAP